MKGYTKKSFRKLLESGNLIPSSFEVIDERRIFYTSPKELQPEIDDSAFMAESILHYFFRLCDKLQLPVNNPIAFFHAVNSRKNEFLSDRNLLKDLRKLLKLVYTDRSFLFGSSFDYFSSGVDSTKDLRLSDLIVLAHSPIGSGSPFKLYVEDPDKDHKEDTIDSNYLVNILLNKQSHLSTSLLFLENYELAERWFDKLEQDNQRCFDWQEQYANQKDYVAFHITPGIAKHFFNIYSYFSLMDISKNREIIVRKELSIIKHAGEAALTFFRFIHIIDRIVNRKGNYYSTRHFSELIIQFLKKGRRLIEGFLNFDDKTKKDIEEQITAFQNALSSEPYERVRDYPLFACGSNIGHLSDNEKCLVDALKSHAFIRCLTKIENELSCSQVQEISAFYLFQIFNHTGGIRSPFLTRNWTLDTKFKCDSSVASSDSTAVLLQKKSICLFNLLIEFCWIVFPRTFDIEFCEYLFERCRAYAPINRFLAVVYDPDKIRSAINPSQKQFPLQAWLDYQVSNNLELDEMGFQQYATTQLSRAGFYKFSTDKKLHKKIWNELENVLTPDIIERYCKIVYYPEDGYGTSCQSREWHARFAEFLDEIIDSNATICDYVDGTDLKYEDVMLPDSDISVATFRAVYTDADGNKPEIISYIPNHAFVQLAIHRICREKIAASTREIALSLFKEIFYDG